jgi:hypothetical protein
MRLRRRFQVPNISRNASVRRSSTDSRGSATAVAFPRPREALGFAVTQPQIRDFRHRDAGNRAARSARPMSRHPQCDLRPHSAGRVPCRDSSEEWLRSRICGRLICKGSVSYVAKRGNSPRFATGRALGGSSVSPKTYLSVGANVPRVCASPPIYHELVCCEPRDFRVMARRGHGCGESLFRVHCAGRRIAVSGPDQRLHR